jgi:hypothetical protein
VARLFLIRVLPTHLDFVLPRLGSRAAPRGPRKNRRRDCLPGRQRRGWAPGPERGRLTKIDSLRIPGAIFRADYVVVGGSDGSLFLGHRREPLAPLLFTSSLAFRHFDPLHSGSMPPLMGLALLPHLLAYLHRLLDLGQHQRP